MELTIWHNPRCSKSRQALALLQEHGVEPTVRLYLKDPPTEDEIRAALKKAKIGAADLVRRGEKRFKELGLDIKDDPDALVSAMAQNPILIERPLVIAGSKAVLGRPPERVLDLL